MSISEKIKRKINAIRYYDAVVGECSQRQRHEQQLEARVKELEERVTELEAENFQLEDSLDWATKMLK